MSREALEPVFALRGDRAQIERLRKVLLGEPCADELEPPVAAVLEERPELSANAVAACVGVRREDVLRVVRELRGGSQRFPRARRAR